MPSDEEDKGLSRVPDASVKAEEGMTRIYDILGRLVAEYRTGVEREWIQQNLARGIYIVVRWLSGAPTVEYVRVP